MIEKQKSGKPRRFTASIIYVSWYVCKAKFQSLSACTGLIDLISYTAKVKNKIEY